MGNTDMERRNYRMNLVVLDWMDGWMDGWMDKWMDDKTRIDRDKHAFGYVMNTLCCLDSFQD
jgi:hypothetical protein